MLWIQGRPKITLYADWQSTTRSLVDMLTPSAYTGRITSPAVFLTSPLNPMSGVTLRVRVLSSSPRSWYAVWKIMLLELPLSTSILFTKQFATVREIIRASWWGARIFSCSLAVKLISSMSRSRTFGWVVSRPCLAFRVLFFAAYSAYF